MNTLTHEQHRLRAEAFRALHKREGIFVAANPWDAGSAKVLQAIGFEALATTSAGLAYTLGKPDGHASITRQQTFDNAQSIQMATSLPLSVDLENGYGHEPKSCAETIMLAAQAGFAGGSIEDATGNSLDPIYPFELAVERVKAAVKAAKTLSIPFTLTARAENLIRSTPNMKDIIKRLVAFADAGADVVFAPGLKTLKEVEEVVKAVAPCPVNAVMGLTGGNFTVDALEQIGVKRVSIGSSFIRAAYGALFRAAREVFQKGSFTYSEEETPYGELNDLFLQKAKF